MLFSLKWGDKFERDLIDSIRDLVEDPETTLAHIVERLVTLGLAYRLKGDQGSPYLSLTEVGQAIADRLYDIDDILKRHLGSYPDV
ncbi:MAG: hypothetical protein ACFFEF_11115 [Candidatus Thorarchaeota archaeon]